VQRQPSGEHVQADLVLADFGCARALTRTAQGAWGSLPDDDGGTLAFTPPEAFEERVQGPHTDVWSAGCVGFSLLFLRPPFCKQGDTDDMVRLRILRGVPLYHREGGGGAAGAEPHAAGPHGKPELDGARAACGDRPSSKRRPAAQSLSAEARAFFDHVLCRDYAARCTAAQAVRLRWLEVHGQEPSVEQPWAPF
jgi:serine/threonine protein kinase